jgi:lysophospholipase L1-like esterase
MTRSFIKAHASALLVTAAIVACSISTSAQPFALKNGQTVVFYGDSITAQRLYTREVEEFVLTRYPLLQIRFVNAGVPGDTASGGYAGTMPERVARDVAPWQPNMITVMLGMNDGGWGYGQPAQIEADFQSRYMALLSLLHQAAPAATLTLISPTPYDEITHGTEFPGYSRMIDRFAIDVTRIAKQMQSAKNPPVLFANFHSPMVKALEQAHADIPQLAPLLIPDRIHPAEAGHWIMAAALMSAWHVDPVVSSVALDVANANVPGANVLKADRAIVTHLSKSANGLEWTELDEALPLPLDFNNAMTPLLLESSDVAELDREMLRVASLAPGHYALTIDGKQVATFSSEELARGVNLALQKTPMLGQARSIASTEEQRAELDQAQFILSANIKQQPATSGIAEATLRAAQDELDAEIREDLILKPHQFELHRIESAQPVSESH